MKIKAWMGFAISATFLCAFLAPSADAADGGVMTRCHAESDGKRWAIVGADFSFEACKARAISCTGNPNVLVHYENMGPVLVPFRAMVCQPGMSQQSAASSPQK